jgi:iron complex outermembrane receptor protein
MFSQSRYNTANWIDSDAGSLANAARGHTATDAAWIQDVWTLAPRWKATMGARYEGWRAYDGSNYSSSPALDVQQPEISGRYVSPKASLAWHPSSPWLLSGSWGAARRMPTVTELYQAITTGATLTVPNPNLRPEHADSYELAAERDTGSGRARLSVFQESVRDALLSQTAPLVAGSTTLYSYVQNVDRTRVRGIELVADRNDVLLRGLELAGTLTYVDGRTIADAAFPAAVGKQIPQLPHWRGAVVATYRPSEALSFTVAARYSTRSYGTIDNSDPVGQTYQGFGGYFVADTRVQYRAGRWTGSLGIDNVNNERYFLFHPFPQRTYVLEIRYAP